MWIHFCERNSVCFHLIFFITQLRCEPRRIEIYKCTCSEYCLVATHTFWMQKCLVNVLYEMQQSKLKTIYPQFDHSSYTAFYLSLNKFAMYMYLLTCHKVDFYPVRLMYLHFVTHINQQNNTPPPHPTICIPVATRGPSLIRNYRRDLLHARIVALSQHVVHYVHDQAFRIRTWQPPGEGLLYSPPEDVLGSSSVGWAPVNHHSYPGRLLES